MGDAGCCRPAGSWPGPSTAGYMATGRAAADLRVCCGFRDRRAGRTGAGGWFPFRCPPDPGVLPDGAQPRGGHARTSKNMVALGTLAAGLAHEINNPASAAVRAVAEMQGDLREVCSRGLGRPGREQSLPAAHFVVIDEVRRQVAGHRGPSSIPSPWPTGRTSCSVGSTTMASSDGWKLAPGAGRGRLRPVGGCERLAENAGRRRHGAGAGVHGQHVGHRRPARGCEGVDRPGVVGLVGDGEVLHPARSVVDPAHRR